MLYTVVLVSAEWRSESVVCIHISPPSSTSQPNPHATHLGHLRARNWAPSALEQVPTCGSVAQSRPTLCDPMGCSTPGFLVFQHLPDSVQTNVHWVSDAIQPSHPLSSFSFCLQSFSGSGSFPIYWLSASGGQSMGVSASASVLSNNIQGWFPLGLTDLISLLSKKLSRVFSITTVRKHPFFSSQPSLWFPLAISFTQGSCMRVIFEMYKRKRSYERAW